MIEVRVPNYTVKDNTVKLECHYDMEDEKLYSVSATIPLFRLSHRIYFIFLTKQVKWYKDGHEFYRYLPRDHPPATLFAQNGVTVDVSALVKFPSFTFLFSFY